MQKIISGIQQIGIGTHHIPTAWEWYRNTFGMRVKIFEASGEAPLMKLYTGGNVHKRDILFALNLQGGGGFQLWQYTDREAQPPAQEVQLGDLGINACKLKARNVKKAYDYCEKHDFYLMSGLMDDPRGNPHFFVSDPEGNMFEVVQGNDWFGRGKAVTGGVFGAVIGVSDIDKALPLYRDLLDHQVVLADQTATFPDYIGMPGGERRMRRVVLQNGNDRQGPFGKLLGNSQIELLQVLDEKPNKIYNNRYWGDLGFMHLGFEVRYLQALKLELEANGLFLLVDSQKPQTLGDATARFAYIEDPDGTLISFIETHRIPLLKKLGWYLDLEKRPQEKAVKGWVLKVMGRQIISL